MLKILMVCEAFGGGIFAYLSQLCNDMCEQFDIYLAFRMRSLTPKNYKDLLDKRIHIIELKNLGRNLISIRDDLKAVRELRELAMHVQPDIIHLHSSISGGIGRIAFRNADTPIVYTPHGYAHILLGPGIKSKMYMMLEKMLGRTNHITLTCCESENKEAQKLCKQTAYIETGINVHELSEELDGIKPIKNEKFTVFSLGRISKQKRPDLFNRIAEMVPNARFLWIGDGELRRELTAPNIEVTGWKPRYEALALAKGADAYILCSYGEAIAISLLENMYIKKLCLVSNTMGNKSVIRDGKNGYICNTAEEYAERIRSAMMKFPEKLTEEAYGDVLKTYNTDAMKQKFVQFYEKIAM